MEKNETAICKIHGLYYSGWCECPICKEQIIREHGTNDYIKPSDKGICIECRDKNKKNK